MAARMRLLCDVVQIKGFKDSPDKAGRFARLSTNWSSLNDCHSKLDSGNGFTKTRIPVRRIIAAPGAKCASRQINLASIRGAHGTR